MERRQTAAVARQWSIPTGVTSKADVLRLLREMESIDDFFNDNRLRKGGVAVVPPRASQMLEAMAATNKVSLLDADARRDLSQYLSALQERAPVVNISFATSPSPNFLDKIVEWFRSEVDPQILLRVGLQPNIAAGCVLRTTNKYFDLSLRNYLAGKEQLLVESVRGSSHSLETTARSPRQNETGAASEIHQ